MPKQPASGPSGPVAPSEPPAAVPPHVAETVETIAKLHARSEREVPRQQRHVEAFTAHLGHPTAVWTIAAAVGFWLLANLALPSVGLRSPDPPPFQWLQTLCSVGALLMATMVLAAQNGQRRAAERHSQLDLHINLLSEQNQFAVAMDRYNESASIAQSNGETLECAKAMVTALKTVVSAEGTAPKAALEHYTVAGKTGTAQKV